MICEIDGCVLGVVQFGVSLQVLFGVLFEVLVMVRGHFAKLTAGCSGMPVLAQGCLGGPGDVTGEFDKFGSLDTRPLDFAGSPR